MQTDVHIRYQEALDMSHHRSPTIIETIFTGNHGHPCISINPDFLHWAYSHRTVLGITCFLGIHRDTVWSTLLEHGIVKPQENPFQSHLEEPVVDVLPFESNELPDPLFYPTQYTSVRHPTTRTTHNIKWQHFWHAGISMLDGMLHRLGHRIPCECIDPVQQVFQCIKIQWWTYSVAGPMALWHNDRQHGSVYLHF